MRNTTRLLAVAVFVCWSALAWPQAPAATSAQAAAAQTGAQAQSQTPPQAPPPATAAAEAQVEAAGPQPLRVLVEKSLLIKTADRVRRVSVTDPAVADAIIVTPYQVLIHGLTAGEVSLIIWNETEQSRIFDLRVDVDVNAAAQQIQAALPNQKIEVSATRGALVLSGHVATKEDADRAAAVASAFTKTVVNALTFGPTSAEQIMLEVKFAEVDRTQLFQWGFNLFSTGQGNTFGGTQTGQFGGISGLSAGATTSDVQGGSKPPGSSIFTSEINNQLFHQPATVGVNDLLNLFLFRTDINLGAVIRALQQKNILQILAEPNLIAVNGKPASFLAGGEFPYPVPQGLTGAITIAFKEFGVRLIFTPVVMPNGAIHLQVQPEVSSLDFSNGLTTNGFVIPALSTRRANTEFELQDGQSFMIAGLLDNRVTDVGSKLPGLGNLPIIGTFFKSKNSQKTATELMVLVTAHRVVPVTVAPPLPNFPKEFLDQKKAAPGQTPPTPTQKKE